MAIGLTLGDGTTNLRTIMRSICFEEVNDRGLFSAAQRDDFINMAHRELYARICETAPSWFAKQSADKNVTLAGLDLSGTGGAAFDANGVHQILRVEFKDVPGNYLALEPYDLQETIATSGPFATIDGNNSFVGFYFLNETLYLYPTPQNSRTLRVTYVPNPADLSATTDTPFSGRFPQFHDTVAYLAAVLALEKDKGEAKIKQRYEIKLELLMNHIRRRQMQKPRTVRFTRWEEI